MAFVLFDDYWYASLVTEFAASNIPEGWFILLTSLLGFYRVKRWERQILASRNLPSGTAPQPQVNIVSQLESNISLRGMSRIDLVRQGFGFGNRMSGPASTSVVQTEGNERDSMLVTRTEDPEQARAIVSASESDARLVQQLREAGFL